MHLINHHFFQCKNVSYRIAFYSALQFQNFKINFYYYKNMGSALGMNGFLWTNLEIQNKPTNMLKLYYVLHFVIPYIELYSTLYSVVSNMFLFKHGSRKQFLCRCSFLEIYQEQIFDLLDTASQGLHLRENMNKGVFVDGLIEQVICNPTDAYQVCC